MRDAYKKADRKEKALILRHSMVVTGLSRKRLIRLFNGADGIAPIKRTGRKAYYSEEVLKHVKRIWLLMEQPCGKKLKVLIPRLLASYRKREPNLTPDIERKLVKISAASIDRYLKIARVQRGISTTRAPTTSWYKNAIPVQAKDWNITKPGYTQADTVSHCGESAAGSFASTLTLTDIDSHWTEMRATFTKQNKGIVRALQDIERSLPFALNTVKFDSGSEFMNYEVVNFLRSSGPNFRPNPIEVLRSRPYRKNDNCYVEQKNLTHVRQFVGYDRIESNEATLILNDLYKNYWCPFLNFFMPTFKLIRKERVGSKIKKKHETPKTPYERILDCAAIPQGCKDQLKAEYEQLDPFELKLKIEEKLKLLLNRIREDKKPEDQLKLAA
jgi:hypothetical protein